MRIGSVSGIAGRGDFSLIRPVPDAETFQLCSDVLKLFYTLSEIFSVVVKTNINKYAERWCAFI